MRARGLDWSKSQREEVDGTVTPYEEHNNPKRTMKTFKNKRGMAVPTYSTRFPLERIR